MLCMKAFIGTKLIKKPSEISSESDRVKLLRVRSGSDPNAISLC
jgi:hypothetical protein